MSKDCVILTSSCGKFNDVDFGNINGANIPRYIDLGQYNDSNGAVKIVLALSEATKILFNELPLILFLYGWSKKLW